MTRSSSKSDREREDKDRRCRAGGLERRGLILGDVEGSQQTALDGNSWVDSEDVVAGNCAGGSEASQLACEDWRLSDQSIGPGVVRRCWSWNWSPG